PEHPLRLIQRPRGRVAGRERRKRAFEAERLAVTVGVEVVRRRLILRGCGCGRRESHDRDEAQIADSRLHWARGGKSFGVTALLASLRSRAVSLPAATRTRCSQSLIPPLLPTP